MSLSNACASVDASSMAFPMYAGLLESSSVNPPSTLIVFVASISMLTI